MEKLVKKFWLMGTKSINGYKMDKLVQKSVNKYKMGMSIKIG